MKSRGGEQALHDTAAFGMGLQGLVGELLDHFERLTAGLAFVFVQGHTALVFYRNANARRAFSGGRALLRRVVSVISSWSQGVYGGLPEHRRKHWQAGHQCLLCPL